MDAVQNLGSIGSEVEEDLEENKKAIADATGVRTKEKAEYSKESADQPEYKPVGVSPFHIDRLAITAQATEYLVFSLFMSYEFTLVWHSLNCFNGRLLRD